MNTSETIKFEKQNLPFEADPNVAHPNVEVSGHDTILSFAIKNSDQIGRIIFNNCVIYRVGDPNDEGFYGLSNDSAYSHKIFPDLEFGYFYEVTGFDWKKGLLGAGVVVIDGQYMNKVDLSHFVFFMKDETFECVCESYKVVSI